ncbi:hypothetical protein BGZ75_002694 [Mortierella antarctica]|nr:hypothetical protein BGZ75_002694 [Mortierella antarctica]
MTVQKQNILIIGGGMAGLGAARELSKHPDVHVTLLEARDRLGGRIVTHRNLISPEMESSGVVPPGSSEIAFDFGASWIHGVDESNPIMRLVKAGHVEYYHTDSDIVYLDRNQQGQSAVPLPTEESNHYWSVVWDLLDCAREYAELNREHIPEEMSLKQWLFQYLESRQSADPKADNYMSEQDQKIVPALSMYWADENAIPIERASMKFLDAEKIFPGDHSLVVNGFDRIIKVMACELKGVRVLLEHIVDTIEYNESEVRVSTNRGVFTADKVLVTLPLGVLKAQSKTLFSPQLPVSKELAIERLSFGTMFKIILFFPTCFWPTKDHFLNFLPTTSSATLSSPADIKPHPELTTQFGLNDRQIEALATYMKDLANYSSMVHLYQKPILIGYATNRAAELMERLSDAEARMVYVCQLAHYFPQLIPEQYQPPLEQQDNTNGDDQATPKPLRGEALWPQVSFMSRWNQDPFARGSYTGIPIHASTSDLEAFQIPVGARMYSALNEDDDYEHDTGNTQNNDEKDSLGSPVLTSVDDRDCGRVFFAGEHTSSSRFASIHGAMMSGEREAAEMLGQPYHI